jgi:hypothetical protein
LTAGAAIGTLGDVPHRREFWARRPYAAPLLAASLVGALGLLLGLLIHAVVVQAAGAAMVMAMLPAAIAHIAGKDDGGEDDEGGGGGPRRPPDPGPPPAPSFDWDEFDAARREWEPARR